MDFYNILNINEDSTQTAVTNIEAVKSLIDASSGSEFDTDFETTIIEDVWYSIWNSNSNWDKFGTVCYRLSSSSLSFFCSSYIITVFHVMTCLAVVAVIIFLYLAGLDYLLKSPDVFRMCANLHMVECRKTLIHFQPSSIPACYFNTQRTRPVIVAI